MKKLVSLLLASILALTALSVFAGAVDGTAPAADVEVAYGTPVIDGTIDAVWANAKVYKYSKYDYATKTEVESEPGQFRLLWDENYIYILAEINDSTVLADSILDADKEWHKRDKLAVCIAPSDSGMFWFGIRSNGSAPNFSAQPLALFITEDSSVAKVTDFAKLPEGKEDTAMFRVAKTANGYLVESKFNIKASTVTGAADFKYEAGTTFGFDTYIYDNITETPAQDHVYPFFDKTVTSYKTNATKAKAILLEKPVEATTEASTTSTEPATTTGTVTPTTPSTGDMTVFFVILAVLAVAGTAIVIVSKRVKN